jgi:hypothetical protein
LTCGGEAAQTIRLRHLPENSGPRAIWFAGENMQVRRESIAGTALLAAMLLAVLVPSGARSAAEQTGAPANEQVPAYHTQPPAGELPQTMDPAEFDNAVVKNAYALAGKVKKVLYQQPCYCHCDRSQGHGSLLDCFTSKHGSMCNVCMGEALYSYEQTRKGKTAVQIREGIEAGEWRHVDSAKYQTYPAKP